MDDLDARVLRRALAWHAEGVASLLVTVARTWGSAPRPPGSLMALDARGRTVGSVSGGCLEDDLVERVRAEGIAALCAGGRPARLCYGVSAEQARRFGLPCGGTVELVLEPVSAASRLGELLQACEARRSTERRLDLASGAVTLSPGRRDGVPLLTDEALTTFVGPRCRLILIGAVDLAHALAQMALGLGFEVVVCDPREEHRAGWRLDGTVLSAEMPDDLVARLRPDDRTAVVALTHDPKLDDLALLEALRSDAFHVAAIGSRVNAERRRERLREHFAASEAMLARLHGPAGLAIGSRTPAEIALSILAAVVAAKNGFALAPVAAVAAVAAEASAAPSAVGATAAG